MGREKEVAKARHVKKLDVAEVKLFQSMEIMYMTGKGNHLVPCLVALDCVSGLNLLVDDQIHKGAGVLESNPYLFPSTEYSEAHVLGWNCIRHICDKANIRNPQINATNQHCRISTMYAALDVPQEEHSYFYKHMGHCQSVNEGTYQRPLPVMAILKVGKHLQHFDNGKYLRMSISGLSLALTS